MSSKNLEKWAQKILGLAGITINGSNPHDIRVVNPDFYKRAVQGSLGLGEAYIKGLWECDKLDEFFYRIMFYDIPGKIGLSLPLLFGFIRAKLFNLQAVKRAFQVGEVHYDTGNGLFQAMLGKSMAYSCGYWPNAKTLDEAQEAKANLICRKLNLQKGQRVLDIGCGWGGFAYYAASIYGAEVVGITVSKEQIKFAEKLCRGLPVEFKLRDYRELNTSNGPNSDGKFNHIVSVGMFEHVGPKNYRKFFEIAKKLLKKDGLFLLHTIGKRKTNDYADPWIGKYIFPNGMLPSLKRITSSVEELFIMEDVHNFGQDYDKTLMAWHQNFEKNWPELKDQYGEDFYRMWRYYLLSCAGAFRARTTQLWQIILSPHGVSGGYKPVR